MLTQVAGYAVESAVVDALVEGEDGNARCGWCVSHEDYVHYHDLEWGRPVTNDVRLYEKICLEGFQSGLSWLTILRKRENFRAAFSGFDPAVVARFDDRDVDRLLGDAGIVRHRGKIEATINNAQATLRVIDEFGSLSALLWTFAPDPSDRPAPTSFDQIPSVSPASTALAKKLKKLGFRFFGPTTAYAAMQSVGMVNDHIVGCHVHDACQAAPRPDSSVDSSVDPSVQP